MKRVPGRSGQKLETRRAQRKAAEDAEKITAGLGTPRKSLNHRGHGGHRGTTECIIRASLAGIYSQIEVDLGAIVELADGLDVAFAAFVLGVDLVVDGGGKGGETVGAIRPHDIGLNRTSAGVGQINDGVRNGVIPLVEDFAEEQAPGGFLLLVRGSA